MKKPRPYRSDRRNAKAALTRASILESASLLFIKKGWVGTTISDIAKQAGVAEETIYSTFGTKREIIMTLVSEALRGSQQAISMMEQPNRKAILDDRDQFRQISRFAEDISILLSRVSPIIDVVRTAATSDPEVAKVYSNIHKSRRRNLHQFVVSLSANGGLHDGSSTKEATSIIWRLASPDIYLLMTRSEGVTQDEFQCWLTKTLKRLLLD